MLLKQLCNCISSQVGHCRQIWIVNQLLQTKERKSALSMGLRILMTKAVKDVENDQAEEAGSAAGPEQGWGWQ